MAVELAGACLHLSRRSIIGGLPSKSLACIISSRFSHDLAGVHNSAYKLPVLRSSFLHRSDQRRRVGDGGRSYSIESVGGFFDGGENEEEGLSAKDGEQEEGTSNSFDDSAISTCFKEIPICRSAFDPISRISGIPVMIPGSWPRGEGFVMEMLERRAYSSDLPISLRILKRKKKSRESVDVSDPTCSSVKKAFSSMVFIVLELQSYAIRMREIINPKNFQIQGILDRVQDELHASFVWLFHHIFSATPTLMLYLMLLLANFTVSSITCHHAVPPPLTPPQNLISTIEESQTPNPRFVNSARTSFYDRRSSAVGGSGSGDGKPPVIAGADDEGHSDRSSSSLNNAGTISPAVLNEAIDEETAGIAWKMILQEAEKMKASERHEALMDPITLHRFVSPIKVELEADDLSAYSSTELSYLLALTKNPEDVLLLSNFAQFLYTVLHDHDRAEEYFRRAARAEATDAEALCRYANFLWVARNDLGAAEETFLEAISADPGNSYYSANYAHFLWSTGGEDTCYPLADCDT